jgi:hypothetical protein
MERSQQFTPKPTADGILGLLQRTWSSVPNGPKVDVPHLSLCHPQNGAKRLPTTMLERDGP